MSTDGAAAAAPENPKWMKITGWVLSGLLFLQFVAFSASGKLMASQAVVEGMAKYGYPANVIRPLGIVEVISAVLFLIPQTSILGAVLLTGYLGGAVATHVRASESWVMAFIVGVFVWGALFLRDPRVRALLPIRRK